MNAAVGVPCNNHGVTDTHTLKEPRTADPTDGEDDRVAHYVRKDDIVRSNVEGIPVKALCGKTWIPNRVPDGLPVCPACTEIMARLRGSPSN